MTTYLICPSVLVSGVWTLDCEEWSEISAPLLWWRGKPSVPRTWCKRWKRESWIRALSTRTCCGSLGSDFEAEWISSLEDSHANPSRLLEVAKPPKTSDISGPTSSQECLFSETESASSRTSMESPQPSHPDTTQFSTMSSATWKKWVSEQRQDSSQRRKSALLTSGSDGSSLGWATPNTMDYLPQRSEESLRKQAETIRKGRSRPCNLREQVNPSAVKIYAEANRWPTPTPIHATRGNHDEPVEKYQKRVRDYEEGRAKGKPGKSLGVAVNWPTPTTGENNYRLNKGPDNSLSERCLGAMARSGLLDSGNNNMTGNTQGHLNPDWVDQLMGFPGKWTALNEGGILIEWID